MYRLLLLSLLPTSLFGQCSLDPTTDLGRLYCELQQRGSPLPSAKDFQANSPQIQALLLKRPAERFGLQLPKLSSPVIRANTESEPESEPNPPAKRRPDPERSFYSVVTSMTATRNNSGCVWQHNYLDCAGQHYQALGNQSNRQLAAGALTSANRLALEPYQNQEPVETYLRRQYPRYLQAMLRIGLAGATQSFNSFYNVFEQNRQQGLVFEQRFETMYGFLKQDKRNNDGARAASIDGLQADQCQLWPNDLATCPAKRHVLLRRIN